MKNRPQCRIVFNASNIIDGGYSLNSILVKGRNIINNIVQIFIRWKIRVAVIHNDVQKIYNTVKLQQEDWCLQRYLWEENIYSNNFPQDKSIKTLVYSVKSSSNQAEYSTKETLSKFQSEYPDANKAIY